MRSPILWSRFRKGPAGYVIYRFGAQYGASLTLHVSMDNAGDLRPLQTHVPALRDASRPELDRSVGPLIEGFTV